MKATTLCLGLIFLPAAAFAMPISAPLAPTSWLQHETGAGFQFPLLSQSLKYDASLQRLTYVSSGLSEYHPGGTGRIDLPYLLTFSLGVNEHGKVTDGGSLIWLGDFGSGYEVLASGVARGLGFGWLPPEPEDVPADYNYFQDLQILFRFDFLNPRVASMGRNAVAEFSFEIATPFTSPFFTDFDCPRGPRCGPYSESGLVGVRVPEPHTIALLAFSLLWLSTLRRRRSTAQNLR